MTSDTYTRLESAFEDYVEMCDSGTYRQCLQSMYREVGPFLQDDRDVQYVENISVGDCRAYAKFLNRRVRDPDERFQASSAHTRFSEFSAWLSFCIRDELLDSNPADKHRAKEPLPEDRGDPDRQFWGSDTRQRILDAADDYAGQYRDQLEEDGWSLAFRNRAVLYTVCYSASRLGELLRKCVDEARQGIYWRDVDLEAGTVRVFGKNREFEQMQLPEPAAQVLADYKEIYQPASDDWPVFPSDGTAHKFSRARDELEKRGFAEKEIEQMLSKDTIHDVMREYDIPPKSVTDAGFRGSFYYDFCEEYDLEVDGERPKLHGARRGIGDELYRDDPTLAQTALRHRDLQTTHDAYSHITAEETARDVEDTIDTPEPQTFNRDGIDTN